MSHLQQNQLMLITTSFSLVCKPSATWKGALPHKHKDRSNFPFLLTHKPMQSSRNMVSLLSTVYYSPFLSTTLLASVLRWKYVIKAPSVFVMDVTAFWSLLWTSQPLTFYQKMVIRHNPHKRSLKNTLKNLGTRFTKTTEKVQKFQSNGKAAGQSKVDFTENHTLVWTLPFQFHLYCCIFVCSAVAFRLMRGGEANTQKNPKKWLQNPHNFTIFWKPPR